MLVPSLISAIGIGLAFVPATISAVAGVDSEEAGLASGLINTARLFGGALGLAVLATIATSHTDADLHHGIAAGRRADQRVRARLRGIGRVRPDRDAGRSVRPAPVRPRTARSRRVFAAEGA